MDSANDFFSNLISRATTEMNTVMVGRIERFDAKKMKADVLPMVRDSQGKELSLLIEVPVALMKAGGFVIRPPYKKGDLVLVVFADNDIDNFMLSGRLSTRNSTRTHSLDDALVIGSILPFTQSLPTGHSNDLVIGTEDFKGKIVMKTDGSILIDGNGVTISGSSRTESW